MDHLEFKRVRKTVLKLTQFELGKLLGLSNDSISRFETGKIAIDPRTRYSLLWLQHCSVGSENNTLPSVVNSEKKRSGVNKKRKLKRKRGY